MLILIEHKDHGRMHVYSQMELDRHIALGWYIVGEKKTREHNYIVEFKRTRGRPKK